MGRKERREQERALARENRHAARIAEMAVARDNARKSVIAKIEQNGITIADLEKEYEKGYSEGFNNGAEPMYRTMMAAISLALSELHGFGKKHVKDVLQRVDEKVIYSLTSAELVEEVFNKIGLEILFHEPFDRVRETE